MSIKALSELIMALKFLPEPKNIDSQLLFLKVHWVHLIKVLFYKALL